MKPGLPASFLAAITALSFWVLPGHTYLQQDTQIYVPILENQWSGALAGDLIVASPHVNFTFYDELSDGIRWVTRAPIRLVLEGQQLVFRALGFFGVYLIALALGLDEAAALVATAMWALGATIAGPAVLTIEYEPSPRSFAVPLLMLAAGLALSERYWWAGIAGACAFLLHAPTTWPFWAAYLALTLIRPRAAVAFVPLAVAALTLIAVGASQRAGEAQIFFARLPPGQEALQRMRASYNYVSLWWKDWMGQYLLFAAVAFGALRRLHASRESNLLLGGLVVAGLLSVPASWWLLEHEKLAVLPQIQPARALLFVTAIAVLGAASAGCRTRHWVEGAAWFAFALLVPAHGAWRESLVAITCAAVLSIARGAWQAKATASQLLGSLLLAPALVLAGGVVNYVNVDTPDLTALAHWARTNAPGTFVFPEAGHDRSPGWFRAQSLQPVYVDWKGGGQVNYLRRLGDEWWRRWQAVMLHPRTPGEYRALGIDYVALSRPWSAMGAPVFHNRHWYVYRTQDFTPASSLRNARPVP
jgi:hypothetical protein